MFPVVGVGWRLFHDTLSTDTYSNLVTLSLPSYTMSPLNCQRYHNRTIYARLPFNVPLAGPFTLRCHPLLWSHGFSSYQCSPLPPQPALQCLSTSRPGPE